MSLVCAKIWRLLLLVTPSVQYPKSPCHLDYCSNFFQGFLLAASDRLYEGDSIRLSKSGLKGQVYRLGWLETVLRGTDDIMVTVPNSELVGNQISNLSRIRTCQVYQTLRFVRTIWIGVFATSVSSF